MANWLRKWKGGRVYVDRDGRERYVIEKMRKGQRYTVTLPAGADPELQLALFKSDPEGFTRRSADTGLLPEDAAVLTVDEIEAFEKVLHERQRSEAHIRSMKHYLAAWCDDLKGRDLRRVHVDDLRKMRDAYKNARNYRTIAIKGYCTWLVKRQILKLGENPAALLEQVRAAPKRLQEGDYVYTAEQIEHFYSILKPQRVRDMFLLVAKTGLHGSEAARIAGKDCKLYELPDKSSGIAAVATVRHKNRRDHKQSLDAQALAAVRRLQAAGGAPCKERIHEAIIAASRRVNCPPVFLRYLRHSFITLANERGREVRVTEGGVPLGAIAAAVGHRSMLMAKDHYLQSTVPPMIVVPLTLRHPEDPTPIQLASSLTARSA
jgi:hypothetical protein